MRAKLPGVGGMGSGPRELRPHSDSFPNGLQEGHECPLERLSKAASTWGLRHSAGLGQGSLECPCPIGDR